MHVIVFTIVSNEVVFALFIERQTTMPEQCFQAMSHRENCLTVKSLSSSLKMSLRSTRLWKRNGREAGRNVIYMKATNKRLEFCRWLLIQPELLLGVSMELKLDEIFGFTFIQLPFRGSFMIQVLCEKPQSCALGHVLGYAVVLIAIKYRVGGMMMGWIYEN